MIRLEDLATVSNLSPFHLTRVFQKEVGIPPYEYLVHIRIKRAQTLLKNGESIAGTAYSTGFSDQSHFTRFFKRHVGITPGEYLRS
jgi:AraC-like DNA-binding protein